MLDLPNYAENSLEVKILQLVASHPQKNYFITVCFSKKGTTLPLLLNQYIAEKVISKSPLTAFRSVYKEGDWRLILTFIPKKGPVDQEFSLSNEFVRMCQKASKK